MFRSFGSSQQVIPASAISSRQSSRLPAAMFQYAAPSSQPPSAGMQRRYASSIPQARRYTGSGSSSKHRAENITFDTIHGVQLHKSLRVKPIHQSVLRCRNGSIARR